MSNNIEGNNNGGSGDIKKGVKCSKCSASYPPSEYLEYKAKLIYGKQEIVYRKRSYCAECKSKKCKAERDNRKLKQTII